MRKFYRCFVRKSLKFETSNENIDYTPVNCENIHPLLVAPIVNGLCKYGSIYTLSLEDFFDMNEILMVKFENERRANEAMNKE